MQKLACVCSLAVAASLSAQTCAPPLQIATNDPFTSSHYLGTTSPPVPYLGFNILFDCVVDAPVNLTQIDQSLYDDGVNPNQVGNTTTLDVWITPTTYIGQEMNQAAWIPLGTGTLTVQSSAAHSPAVFSPPLTLPVGSWGVALQTHGTQSPMPNFGPLHPLLRIPCLSPGNPVGCTLNPRLSAQNEFLNITNTNIQRYSWTSGLGGLFSINIQIFYTLPANTAFHSEYGVGCYALSQSFYQWFQNPAAVDLSNQGITLVPNGTTSYLVIPSSSTFAPVSSAPLNNAANTGLLGDDETTAAQTLPFTFNFPGGATQGSTSQIVIGSNGYVWLTSVDGGAGPFYDNVNGLFSGLPRICPYWGDLDPSTATGSGTVHFDVDPSNTFAYVTWQNVQEWTGTPGGTPMNIQVLLYANGQIDLRYGNVAMIAASALTGFSPGGNDLDPGSHDLVVGGVVQSFTTGDGTKPLHLTGANRPVLGSTFNFKTDTIRAGSTAGFQFFSFTPQNPGIDLGFLGMNAIASSHCSAYLSLVNPISNRFFLVTGPSVIVPLAIPSLPVLNGLQVFSESAVLNPGLNTAGILASNGLCVTVGLQ